MSRRFRVLRGSDGSPLSVLGLSAIAALLLTILLAVLIVRPYLDARAALPELTKPVEPSKTQLPTFDATVKQYAAQIDGRSPFFIPDRPSRDNGPHDAPREYGGPALIAMINGVAWFADGDRVSQSRPDGKTVKLVQLRAPWGARVEWEGGEFDVDLFKRVPLSSLRDTLGKPGPDSTAMPTVPANGTGFPPKPGPPKGIDQAGRPGAPPAPPAADAPATESENAEANENRDPPPPPKADAPNSSDSAAPANSSGTPRGEGRRSRRSPRA